jgi:hypothetical protein
MGPDTTANDWAALADRLEALADDLLQATGVAADGSDLGVPTHGAYDAASELDTQAIQLWSLSLTHYAIQIRQMKCSG